MCSQADAFDLLHAGHISLLERAVKLGTTLIVGINTDESVRRLKGPGRPIDTLTVRIKNLMGTGFVDQVIPFGEDTPENLIRALRPDWLVHGDDCCPLPGAKFVKSYGGRLRLFSKVRGFSTTEILKCKLRTC